MNKYIVLGIFVVIFFGGLGVILVNESVSLSEFFRSLSNLNPRVLSILALPILGVFVAFGIYYRKKSQERMWKKALLKTRAKAAERAADQSRHS